MSIYPRPKFWTFTVWLPLAKMPAVSVDIVVGITNIGFVTTCELSANRGALFKLFDMYCDIAADETPTFSACTAFTCVCPVPVC